MAFYINGGTSRVMMHYVRGRRAVKRKPAVKKENKYERLIFALHVRNLVLRKTFHRTINQSINKSNK